MNKLLNIILTLLVFFLTHLYSNAQKNSNKVWFNGLARSFFARDAIDDVDFQDTLSPRNISSGYNLLDLNTHVNPSSDIEIFAQLRVRNQFGSFFGSGTSVNVRQLRASGVINNKVNFSVGDIYLKQNRFTLFNEHEDLYFNQNTILNPYKDIIHYENFYKDNRWRLQGLQTDFSFEFDRFLRALEFDFFITRPRGSYQLNSTSYSPDLLLGGGTISSKITNKLCFEINYVNFYEVPSSGNLDVSIRNPVYHAELALKNKIKNFYFNQKIQSGFSQRNWLFTDFGVDNYDSVFNYSEGMFFEFNNELFNKDSSLTVVFGVRYVDPNFRSAGAQTRRIDFNDNLTNTIYPTYGNDMTTRSVTMFDVISDENIYNQNLSGKLMNFNPLFSNVNPYGNATPNRESAYLSMEWENNLLEASVNSSFSNEVIGQGTVEKRQFFKITSSLKLNINELLSSEKEISFCLLHQNENTLRIGDSTSSINLNSMLLSGLATIELGNKFFFQIGVNQFKSNGNEFLTTRNSYDNIQNFTLVNYDRQDFLNSAGFSYKLNNNIYVNLQYNWWGSLFNNQLRSDFNYNRLLFIFSVKL